MRHTKRTCDVADHFGPVQSRCVFPEYRQTFWNGDELSDREGVDFFPAVNRQYGVIPCQYDFCAMLGLNFEYGFDAVIFYKEGFSFGKGVVFLQRKQWSFLYLSFVEGLDAFICASVRIEDTLRAFDAFSETSTATQNDTIVRMAQDLFLIPARFLFQVVFRPERWVFHNPGHVIIVTCDGVRHDNSPFFGFLIFNPLHVL